LVPAAHGQRIIVLIVDDSDDDDLAYVLASKNAAPNGYRGAWRAQVTGERLTVEFRLARRDDDWERLWTYPEPGQGIVNEITAHNHRVAIVPVIGDLSEFVRDGERGALIVDAEASGAVASARTIIAASAAP